MRRPADNVADREFLQVDTNLATAAGAWNGLTHVNKFGYAPDGVQVAGSDIWDRADATPTQRIWLKPQVSQVHEIVSTSGLDSAGGAGARTVRIYGLIDWDSKEISEDINMAGVTAVDTVNQYVIIHRMTVLTFGATVVNAGTITATAKTNRTVTAQINPSHGQTQMAIYGIPSVQTAYLTNWYGSIHKASGTAVDVRFELQYAIDMAPILALFLKKEIRGLQSTGSSTATWAKKPYKKFVGPGILKIQAYGSGADIDAAAGFDLILVDN